MRNTYEALTAKENQSVVRAVGMFGVSFVLYFWEGEGGGEGGGKRMKVGNGDGDGVGDGNITCSRRPSMDRRERREQVLRKSMLTSSLYNRSQSPS